VAEIPWPREVVLVAVERDDGVLLPRGNLEIAAGDRLSIFADPAARSELDALLAMREHPSSRVVLRTVAGGAAPT